MQPVLSPKEKNSTIPLNKVHFLELEANYQNENCDLLTICK